jgi:hypothetical protein
MSVDERASVEFRLRLRLHVAEQRVLSFGFNEFPGLMINGEGDPGFGFDLRLNTL